jgi:hypothetical protein
MKELVKNINGKAVTSIRPIVEVRDAYCYHVVFE